MRVHCLVENGSSLDRRRHLPGQMGRTPHAQHPPHESFIRWTPPDRPHRLPWSRAIYLWRRPDSSAGPRGRVAPRVERALGRPRADGHRPTSARRRRPAPMVRRPVRGGVRLRGVRPPSSSSSHSARLSTQKSLVLVAEVVDRAAGRDGACQLARCPDARDLERLTRSRCDAVLDQEVPAAARVLNDGDPSVRQQDLTLVPRDPLRRRVRVGDPGIFRVGAHPSSSPRRSTGRALGLEPERIERVRVERVRFIEHHRRHQLGRPARQ